MPRATSITRARTITVRDKSDKTYHIALHRVEYCGISATDAR
jgi:hypothetical protein